MLVEECGAGGNMGWNTGSIGRGGWTTPVGCRNSSMSFGGSVPSLHPSGSMRSLRSQHSMQPASETPVRCVRCCHPPLQTSTPNNCAQQQQHHQPTQYCPASHYIDGQNGTFASHRTNSSSYHGDPLAARCTDLDDSAIGNGNWILGDLRSLHRCVPALRRTGIDVSGMRMHFYPEGGWGWLICAAGFLATLLTTGLQLSFGVLHLHAARHFGDHRLMDIAWIGALSAAVSRASAPLILGTCRRGSTRLTAVIGGLILALAALFTSFAVQLHQVALSYGLVLGAAAGLVRETAGLMLGHYFRKRREFVEMVVHAGTGVGIALFSVSYKEAVGKLGWRLGLQAITGVLFLAFFLGLIYRSASLYHPQRHAILHLKNQQSKLKPKSSKLAKETRQPLIDLSPLASRPVRMLMLAAAAASFGLYTPAFYIALQGHQDGLEASALVLLQTCLGLSAALGCAAWGLITVRPSVQCLVSRQYLCQTALLGVAIAQLALGSVQGYHGLVLAAGLYGISLGGSLYSLKMLALERLKARTFAKSWALIQAAEALPVLFGVPLAGYMNASNPRVGYYVCTLSSLCGAALLFLVGWGRRNPCSPTIPGVTCPCATAAAAAAVRSYSRLPKSQSLHVPLNRPESAMQQHHCDHEHEHNGQQYSFCGCTCAQHHHLQFRSPCRDYHHHYQHEPTLRPSKSVPEGLGGEFYYQQQQHHHLHHHHHPLCRPSTPHGHRPRDVTVIEQITTCV